MKLAICGHLAEYSVSLLDWWCPTCKMIVDIHVGAFQ